MRLRTGRGPWPIVLALVGVAGLVALAVPILTIARVPTPTPDLQLYASIARGVQKTGLGIPTLTLNSPVAVDHVPFYGPVYFQLAALAMTLGGVSVVPLRIVSLIGGLIFVLAVVALSRRLSDGERGWIIAATLALLAPETNFAVTSGTMHSLAVGFETAALAAFVRTSSHRYADAVSGIAAGLLLTLAALTTPRSYPLIFGFLCAGVLPLGPSTREFPRLKRYGWAVVTLVAAVLAWTWLSQGGPWKWVRLMAYVATHEDTDVAVLPTAVRMWEFRWSAVITPIAAVYGAILAARLLNRSRDGARDHRSAPIAFLLCATWIGFVTTTILMNFTFMNAEYFILPLFAVVIAIPSRWWGVRRRLLAIGATLLVLADCGVLGVRYARAFVTWRARDPGLIERFVTANIPPGTTVIGPNKPAYYFAVVGAGRHLRAVTPESWADWARWVPVVDPSAVDVARPFRTRRPPHRMLLWPTYDKVPTTYACALPHLVAVFTPPDAHLEMLGPFGSAVAVDTGFSTTALYDLPAGCPTGYDPTGD